jgi:isopentenyl-diphosphate delta-isomerase
MPRRTRQHTTSSRKQQHVQLTLTRDVGFRSKTTGLEKLEFVHNALPEIDLAEVDTACTFLGRGLRLPLIITGMTGGYREALAINRQLAEAAQEAGIAMGVGSQRQALEYEDFHRTFSVVREAAPEIPIIGNLGAAEVARLRDVGPVQRLAELAGADAFAVHLNPLQELLQPEGTPAFRGVLAGIERLVRGLRVPVIVKEIGAGISADVARRLAEVGVRIIDVAGAGGTSWAGVEILRQRPARRSNLFWDWGIPTAEALRAVVALARERGDLTVIASGGISSGVDAAKCLALGASLAGAARPVLSALARSGKRGLRSLLERWSDEIHAVMFLTGSRTLEDLRKTPLHHAP